MSDRDQYVALSTAILVVAGIAVAVDAALYGGAVSQHQPYHFWTGPAMIVSYVLGVLAVLLFAAALARKPLPPWKHPKFPRLRIDVEHTQTVTDAKGDTWMAFDLVVSNDEPDQHASLTFAWRGKLRPGYRRSSNPYGEDWGETPFAKPHGEPPDDFPTEWLTSPLNVPPKLAIKP